MSAADRNVPAEVVDRVSNAIRSADGAHTMGAGALAEVAVAAMLERPVRARTAGHPPTCSCGLCLVDLTYRDGSPVDLGPHRHAWDDTPCTCDNPGDAFTVSRRPLQTEALDLLALTADYPVEHPLRQAAARLTTRLALAEGKIQTATAVLEKALDAVGSMGAHVSYALSILRR